MSYLPSPYTGYYTRVDNTVVSGSQLYSYLSGRDLRQLEFDAAVHSPPAIAPVTTPGTSMTANQLIQASIATLPVVPASVSTASQIINLGTDSVSQAGAYVSLFNLASTNDIRVLRFVLGSANLSGSATILLQNSSGTSSNVVVQLNGASGSNSQSMFTVTGVGQALSGVSGSERIVLLSATNLNSGSQAVVFNVLGNSQ